MDVQGVECGIVSTIQRGALGAEGERVRRRRTSEDSAMIQNRAAANVFVTSRSRCFHNRSDH